MAKLTIPNENIVRFTVNQGTEAQRNSSNKASFLVGELAFTRDTQRLFVGNYTSASDVQSTTGGALVGNKMLDSYTGSLEQLLSNIESAYTSGGSIDRWNHDSSGAFNIHTNAYDGDFIFSTKENAFVFFDQNIQNDPESQTKGSGYVVARVIETDNETIRFKPDVYGKNVLEVIGINTTTLASHFDEKQFFLNDDGIIELADALVNVHEVGNPRENLRVPSTIDVASVGVEGDLSYTSFNFVDGTTDSREWNYVMAMTKKPASDVYETTPAALEELIGSGVNVTYSVANHTVDLNPDVKDIDSVNFDNAKKLKVTNNLELKGVGQLSYKPLPEAQDGEYAITYSFKSAEQVTGDSRRFTATMTPSYPFGEDFTIKNGKRTLAAKAVSLTEIAPDGGTPLTLPSNTQFKSVDDITYTSNPAYVLSIVEQDGTALLRKSLPGTGGGGAGGGFRPSGTDFDVDVNNVFYLKDTLKDIERIETVNALSLPSRVTFGDTVPVTFVSETGGSPTHSAQVRFNGNTNRYDVCFVPIGGGQGGVGAFTKPFDQTGTGSVNYSGNAYFDGDGKLIASDSWDAETKTEYGEWTEKFTRENTSVNYLKNPFFLVWNGVEYNSSSESELKYEIINANITIKTQPLLFCDRKALAVSPMHNTSIKKGLVLPLPTNDELKDPGYVFNSTKDYVTKHIDGSLYSPMYWDSLVVVNGKNSYKNYYGVNTATAVEPDSEYSEPYDEIITRSKDSSSRLNLFWDANLYPDTVSKSALYVTTKWQEEGSSYVMPETLEELKACLDGTDTRYGDGFIGNFELIPVSKYVSGESYESKDELFLENAEPYAELKFTDDDVLVLLYVKSDGTTAPWSKYQPTFWRGVEELGDGSLLFNEPYQYTSGTSLKMVAVEKTDSTGTVDEFIKGVTIISKESTDIKPSKENTTGGWVDLETSCVPYATFDADGNATGAFVAIDSSRRLALREDYYQLNTLQSPSNALINATFKYSDHIEAPIGGFVQAGEFSYDPNKTYAGSNGGVRYYDPKTQLTTFFDIRDAIIPVYVSFSFNPENLVDNPHEKLDGEFFNPDTILPLDLFVPSKDVTRGEGEETYVISVPDPANYRNERTGVYSVPLAWHNADTGMAETIWFNPDNVRSDADSGHKMSMKGYWNIERELPASGGTMSVTLTFNLLSASSVTSRTTVTTNPLANTYVAPVKNNQIDYTHYVAVDTKPVTTKPAEGASLVKASFTEVDADKPYIYLMKSRTYATANFYNHQVVGMKNEPHPTPTKLKNVAINYNGKKYTYGTLDERMQGDEQVIIPSHASSVLFEVRSTIDTLSTDEGGVAVFTAPDWSDMKQPNPNGDWSANVYSSTVYQGDPTSPIHHSVKSGWLPKNPDGSYYRPKPSQHNKETITSGKSVDYIYVPAPKEVLLAHLTTPSSEVFEAPIYNGQVNLRVVVTPSTRTVNNKNTSFYISVIGYRV